jgi:NAD(P)-dependent dehydrogenase (short-subunit alcohol dehydrogenase family)
MRAFIRAQTGGLDILVNNAALKAKPFPGEISFDYVEKNLSMAATPTESFASLLNPNSAVIFISSLYVKKPEAGFEDYIKSKRRVEEFARRFSQGHQAVSVVVARPPRLRIQQGFALPAPGAADPVRIAGELVEKISNPPVASFYDLDLA